MIRRFNRFELKYVIPLSTYAAIERDLLLHLVPDPNGPPSGYHLVSLYYDSPDLDCFWSKIEGLKFRRKLRLRIYHDGDPATATQGMVEIKERDNRTVRKRRLALPIARAVALCEGQPWPAAAPSGVADPRTAGGVDSDAEDSAVANEVNYLVGSLALRPTAITAYHRKALQGVGPDAGLRVTFDTDFSARMGALDVRAHASNHPVLACDHAIMEVKVDDAVPDWMVSLLARHGCHLQRISKYCAGVSLLRHPAALPLAVGAGVALAFHSSAEQDAEKPPPKTTFDPPPSPNSND